MSYVNPLVCPSSTKAGPMDWLLSLLPSAFLLLYVQQLGWFLLTGVPVHCDAIARWPALDYKSDRAFYPLMVSFSRYPFHDVYETVPTGALPKIPPPTQTRPPAPPPAGRGASLLAKARKSFPLAAAHQRDWRHQNHPIKMPSKSICQGLIYLPQELQASGRRMLPPKMRKLLKYCGFI